MYVHFLLNVGERAVQGAVSAPPPLHSSFITTIILRYTVVLKTHFLQIINHIFGKFRKIMQIFLKSVHILYYLPF